MVTQNFQSGLYQYYLQQNAEMKESGLFTKKVPEWEKKFLESDLSEMFICAAFKGPAFTGTVGVKTKSRIASFSISTARSI